MAKIYSQGNKMRLVFLVFFLTSFLNRSTSQEPVLALTPVLTGLSTPMQLVNAGDGTNRIFIVERAGVIEVYDQAFNAMGTFLTIPSNEINTVREGGLLSMAFHPDYSTNGLFFVYYTNSDGDLEIARYQVSAGDANVADPAKTVVLSIPHTYPIPPGEPFHNGGTIRFGTDGFLYLAAGDGGGEEVPSKAQDAMSLLGKMIRIDINAPTYTIPPSNPFVSATDTLHEIYAFGLRNPFRWNFDKSTGDMWIGDVGESGWEEINYVAANSASGVNYGWRCYEGEFTLDFTSDCDPTPGTYIPPVFAYPNTSPISVIGGTVYRGTTVPANASLRGFYLAADFYKKNIYKIKPNGSGSWITYIQSVATDIGTGRIVDFGEAENGELFAVDFTSGTIYSIVGDAPLPVTLAEFTADVRNGIVQLNWKTSSEENLQQFEIEYGIDGTSFIRAGIVPAANAANGSEYTFSHEPSSSGRVYYRLKMMDFDGQFKYSGIVMMTINRSNKSFIQPSVITTGVINVFLNSSFNTLEVINMNGSVLLKQNIKGRTGKIDVPVPSVTAGIYIVQLRNNETTAKQLILVR